MLSADQINDLHRLYALSSKPALLTAPNPARMLLFYPGANSLELFKPRIAAD